MLRSSIVWLALASFLVCAADALVVERARGPLPDRPAPTVRAAVLAGRLDSAGDPIPPEAVCRVGSIRTRDVEFGFMAVTPDGSRVVCGSSHKLPVDVRDTRTLRRSASVRLAEAESLCGLAISDDGTRVAALIRRSDGVVHTIVAKVWEGGGAKPVCEVVLGDGSIHSEPMAFSSDGRRLAVRLGEVHLIDIASAKIERVVSHRGLAGDSLAFVGGGRYVHMQRRDESHFFDPVADKSVPDEWHRTPEPKGIGHRRFSPDGKWVVLTSVEGVVRYRIELPTADRETVRMSDPVRVSNANRAYAIVALDSSSDRCLCVGDETAWVVDFRTGSVEHSRHLRGMSVVSGTFAGDEVLVVCRNSSGRTAYLEVTELVSGVHLNERAGVMHLKAPVKWSADGRELIDGDARWDATTGRRIAHLVGPFREDQHLVLYTPTGTEHRLRSQDGRKWLVMQQSWLQDGAAGGFGGGAGGFGGGGFNGFGGGAGGFGGGAGGSVPTETTSIGLRNAFDGGRSIAFRPLGEGLPQHLSAQGFSADGRIYATDRDGSTEVWNTGIGRRIVSIPNGPHNTPLAGEVTIAPDGRRVLIVSDRFLRVLDTRSGTVESELILPTGDPYTQRKHDFSPDGRWAAEIGSKSGLRLFDLHRREFAKTFATDALKPSEVKFSPDGRRVVAVDASGFAVVWDVPTTASPFLPLAAGDLERAWADLKLPSAAAAKGSLERLARSGDVAATWIAERVKPAKGVPPKDLRAILTDLGDINFRRREAAEARLRLVADECLAELEAASLSEKDAEVRTRIARVLGSPVGAATDPEVLRHLRAVEVLERVGTAKAMACLERLATGAPSSRITEEAVSALGRRKR